LWTPINPACRCTLNSPWLRQRHGLLDAIEAGLSGWLLEDALHRLDVIDTELRHLWGRS